MSVYIFTLANTETGGPELLHQLSFVLNAMGIDARTVYYYGFEKKIIEATPVESYEKYNVVTETNVDIIDRPENVIVVPEQAYEFFGKFKYCKKVAWWLSVDGYFNVLRHIYNVPENKMKDPKIIDWYKIKGDSGILHLVQSEYARQFVKKHFEPEDDNIDYLSDYVNDIYLSGQVNDNSNRRNMVVFNPAKGLERIRRIIEKTQGDILWYPIVNMTPIQVRAALNIAKVYIDFGNHPGKDRIPREAAISGCCVITGKRGSAAFFEDVSIPDKYKFRDTGEDDDKVISLIKDIFENFEGHYVDFDDYRERIMEEKELFIMDAMRIFGKLQ